MQNHTVQTGISNGLPMPEKSCRNILFEALFSNSGKDVACFYIKHPKIVRHKLNKMITLGAKEFQVISDFDWTMSRFVNDKGEVNPTCHGVFENDPEITPEARKKLKMLKQTYGAVEFDNNIPHSLKIPHMVEWWNLSHLVIVSCKIHRHTLKNTVYNSNLQLRDRVSDFINTLNAFKIPMVVFSAGLGNVIELSLEKENLLLDNVKIASNFMNFDVDGLLVGFESPLIHTFNKTFNGMALSDRDRGAFSRRRSIMLLGDSLYDQHMADGLIDENTEDDVCNDNPSVILRIGFLNGKVETLLEEYMNLYDIVLTRQSGFDLPLEIVKSIVE